MKNVYFTYWNGAGGEALGAAINGLANNTWIDIRNDGYAIIPRQRPMKAPDYDGAWRYTIDNWGLVPGGCSGTWWQNVPNHRLAKGAPDKVIMLVNPDIDMVIKKVIIKHPRRCYTGHKFIDRKIAKYVEKDLKNFANGVKKDWLLDPYGTRDMDACMRDLGTIYYYVRERLEDQIHAWYDGMHDRLKRENIPYIQINSNMVSSEEIVDAIKQCQEFMGWSHPITEEAMAWIREYATKNYETLKLATDWEYRKTK